MRVRVTNIRNMALRRLAIVASIVPLFVVTFPLALLSNILVLWQSAYLAWTQREARPEQCEVGRVGNALVIRMPLDLLAHVAKFAPCVHHDERADGEGGFEVTDPVEFAHSVQRALLRETDESGSTLVHEMFDDAIEAVLDNGDDGFRWPAIGVR